MWQLEPVSHSLRKPALYQGLVLQAWNRRLPAGDAYRTGGNIFSRFQLFQLEVQQRAVSNYAKYLENLLDVSKKNPITESWEQKLRTLTKKGIDDDPDWQFVTITTTRNVESLLINNFQSKRFG